MVILWPYGHQWQVGDGGNMIHEKDMSTTRPEFFRCLGGALANLEHEIAGDHIVVHEGSKSIEMTLAPLPPRVLSITVQMERWLLRMEFIGYSKGQSDDFLKQFDRAFHRGGG